MIDGRPLDRGDTLPGYLLDDVIGRDMHSTLFGATRLADGQQVALKIVPVRGGQDQVARVHGELDRIEHRELTHPRILAPTARGSLPGDTGIWFEIEVCRDSVLELLSEADAPLAIPDASRLMIDALGGLAHLHDRPKH